MNANAAPMNAGAFSPDTPMAPTRRASLRDIRAKLVRAEAFIREHSYCESSGEGHDHHTGADVADDLRQCESDLWLLEKRNGQ